MKNKGITLIALIVTIIVLIILAGVTISIVLKDGGILSKAKQSTEEYSKSKSEEKLILVLSEAQIIKYESGLSEEELDKKIEEVGELQPKEDLNSNYQKVIVDRYIFLIDRSVPEIVDYVGPADGVIITATVRGNDDWIKPGEAVTLLGTIKTYSGGTIVSSTATSNGIPISEFTINKDSYTMNNITEDTIIIITATDSKGKTNTKTVPIYIKRDTEKPVITSLNITTTGLKILIDATAEDNETGIKEFTYSISPTTGISEPIGTFTQPIEIESTIEETYKVTITAKDNSDNLSDSQTVEVITIDGISIADAKAKVNATTLKDYIGTKVAYKSGKGGTWRVFYYDEIGDFGPQNTLYLKRDWVSNDTYLANYSQHVVSDAGTMMKRMNPLWAANSSYNKIDQTHEYCVSWLCDPKVWEEYKTSDSSFAIGSPSVEMYIKAYNVYMNDNKALIYKLGENGDSKGYMVGSNGAYANGGFWTNDQSVKNGPNNIFFIPEKSNMWLASPSANHNSRILYIDGGYAHVSYQEFNGRSYATCPIVPLDQ